MDCIEKKLPVNKQGGGGIIITVDRRKDLESPDIETVWIQLCPPKRPAHLLCTAYQNPDYDVSVWLEKFEFQITNAYLESCELTIMGDFNIDLMVNSPHRKSWLEITENLQLHQLIK